MDEELSEERRERIQSRITKAIVADTGQEKIDQIISANELSEEITSELIAEGQRVRLDIIRGLQMKKLRLGLFIMIAGIASIYMVAFVVGSISQPIFYIALFIVALGLAMIVAGVVGIASARKQRGSFLSELE